MTPTYKRIQKKIESLQRQADKLRASEVHGVISRIKVAIEHYGLTAEQLGFGAKAMQAKAKPGKTAPAQTAKYSDGNGNAWSGRGPRPRWLRDALNAGRTLEEFGAAAVPAKASGGSKKAPKRRPSSVLYRDEAGHSWTGRGPRPRWLKDALASGRTIEELSR
jgi:DNA-binding protein H-NS